MRVFGTLPDGRKVHAIDLAGHGLRATILTYGAILQDLRMDGLDRSLTLGSDRLKDYLETIPYHGSITGPVCNRLTGARAVIAGTEHHFDANFQGAHTLHSGSGGTHLKVWDIDIEKPESATLRVNLPNGEAGFPGNHTVTARFQLLPDATLRLTISTVTDASTIINLTNHSYWNLDGTPTFAGHKLRIAADRFLPADGHAFPTGKVAEVAGTPLDFRSAALPRPGQPPFDNTFVPTEPAGQMRDVLWLRGTSDIRMTVATDQPGIHIYDGRGPARPGRTTHEGIAVEAQGWPDAPNQPGFPSIELHPGETRVQTTEWRFEQL